jgi:hypothetical protein
MQMDLKDKVMTPGPLPSIVATGSPGDISKQGSIIHSKRFGFINFPRQADRWVIMFDNTY